MTEDTWTQNTRNGAWLRAYQLRHPAPTVGTDDGPIGGSVIGADRRGLTPPAKRRNSRTRVRRKQ